MNVPSMKRVTINSEPHLRAWLKAYDGEARDVMLVTQTKASPKHVSAAQVGDAVESHGWRAGRRYTLNAHLVGHVIEMR